jgi:hypothetical protein
LQRILIKKSRIFYRGGEGNPGSGEAAPIKNKALPYFYIPWKNISLFIRADRRFL